MPNVTGGIVEYFDADHDRDTYTASGTIAGGNLVELTGNRTVAAAPAGSLKVIGIALHDAVSGDKVTVAHKGIWPVVASGAIAAGDGLEAGAAGAARVLQTVDAAGSFNPRALVAIALEAISNGVAGRVKILR